MTFRKIQKFLTPKPPFKELVWPILGCVSLLIVCVITSNRKYFWMDELLTYYPASMPSFSQMISFVNDKINCGSPGYFIAVWFWAKVFSASELSLRLFSSLCFSAALIFTWLMLRRRYNEWIATLSSLVVFLGSALILYQNSEARFYGLLLALCALLSKQTIDRLRDNASFNIRTCFTQIFLHGLLPLTHPFGFVYSFMHTIASVIIDVKRGVFRSWYYLSAFVGWLFFIPFIPAFLRQSELAKPHFWVRIPSLKDLSSLYFGDNHFNSIVFILMVIVLFLSLKTKRQQKIDDEPILIIGVLYALVPIGIWLESQFFTPLFKDRYFISIGLSWAIFLSAIFVRILPEIKDLEFIHQIVLSLVVVVIITLPINNAFKLLRPEKPDAYLMSLYPTLPVVTDVAFSYLPLAHYSLDAKRYYYVLDWEIALNPRNSLHATNDFQTLQALKSHIQELNIVTTNEFLNKYSRFIVISWRGVKWFEYRIMNNPKYKIKDLGHSLYLVETKISDKKGK